MFQNFNFNQYKGTLVALASTLFILFIFQCGAHITAPSIVLKKENLSGLSQLLNLFGGGGLRKVSIFAIGISPYITAQIIIQMFSNDVIKHLSDLRKLGEVGRYKMELYTRIFALPFSIMTSLATLHLLSGDVVTFRDVYNNNAIVQSFSQLKITQRALMVLLFVAGTYITLFLSDIISKKGVGNGITLIIMSGIISSLPENFITAYKFFENNLTVLPEYKTFITIFKFLIYVFFYLLMLILIIFINGTVRKIPLQQTGSGMILQKDKLSYLPIKLMPAGIIPAVFAGSIMIFPVGIAEALKNVAPGFTEFVSVYFSFNDIRGLSIYFCLIVLFSFFYSKIQINVEELTKNFQKQSKFIPGIRTGQHTYNYINSVINCLNCIGAPFLGFVAIMPNLLNMYANMPSNIAFGGTGIIIMVSGALQMYEEVKSTHIISKYKEKQEYTDQFLINAAKKQTNSSNLLW